MQAFIFLEQGTSRGYLRLKEKITHWFGFENDFVTSFDSFITQQTAVENIQLLEGNILRSIAKENTGDTTVEERNEKAPETTLGLSPLNFEARFCINFLEVHLRVFFLFQYRRTCKTTILYFILAFN
jgi:hypothetical protein